MAAVKVVLLDIEGTVCPISFVKEVLFPYALDALPAVLEDKWDDPAFAQYREAFPDEFSASKTALEQHVRDLVEKDVKVAYLKSLQGYLWKEGYASGEIKAPLFADVPPKLAMWTKKGLKVMIYSSGSVPAQKLLFRYTNAEPSDLTSQISDWFDTVNAGLKTETSSYSIIADNHPETPIGEWLFLSDNIKEVEAAIAAGMQSYVVQRPGNAELPAEVSEKHTVIETFDVLDDDCHLLEGQQLAGQKRARSPDASEKPKDVDATQPTSTPGSQLGNEDQPESKKARQSGTDCEKVAPDEKGDNSQ